VLQEGDQLAQRLEEDVDISAGLGEEIRPLFERQVIEAGAVVAKQGQNVVQGLMVPETLEDLAGVAALFEGLRPAVPDGLPAGGHDLGQDLAEASDVDLAAFEGGEGGEDLPVGAKGLVGYGDLAYPRLAKRGPSSSSQTTCPESPRREGKASP